MDKNRQPLVYAIVVFLIAEVIQTLALNILKVIVGTASKNVDYRLSVLAVLISGIVFFFWYRYEIRGEERLGLKTVVNIKTISLLLILAIGCQLFASGLLSSMNQLLPKLLEGYYKQIKDITFGYDAVALLLILLVAPITEELIFRGMILHKASKALPFLWANLLQAVLFGIYHWNLIQGIYAAVIGFVLGLIYRRYKSIIAPMLLHLLINASSLPMSLFPDRTAYGIGMLLIGAVCILLAFYKGLRYYTTNNRIS